MNPSLIQISANNGWNTIEGELKSCLEKSGDILLILEIKISSQNWTRSKVLKGEPFELQEEAVSTLKQVVLSRKKLELLHDNLIKWATEPFLFEFDLTGDPSQPVMVGLRAPKDHQSRPLEKPVFIFRVGISHGLIESFFVVDQSCLKIFQEGVVGLLESTGT